MSADRLEVRILGCGSSGGVPRLGGADEGGNWGQCDPQNPKNRRRRCSILVRRKSAKGETRVLVDTSPDLREQLLEARIARLDGVLITHDHADQTHGMDDLRAIAQYTHSLTPVWCDSRTWQSLMGKFAYCFVQPPGSDYPPILAAHEIHEPFRPFVIEGPGGPVPVEAFIQGHGQVESLGFRFGPVAYSSDVNRLDEAAFAALEGVECWIVDALRRTPHPSHAHLAKSLEWIARLRPRRAVLTNMHLDMDYQSLCRELPKGVEPAFDGLSLEFPAP
jgi:phosphoribosyl 1,2-cyclic phosphate phosphodiesterase